jgi:hypothetical protein
MDFIISLSRIFHPSSLPCDPYSESPPLSSLLMIFCTPPVCPFHRDHRVYRVGWVDIGTGTKVPLRFVTYISNVTKINEKSVLAQ